MPETLKDVLPHEFMGSEYTETQAYKYRDVEVVEQHNRAIFEQSWPGKHKHVNFWVKLKNGVCVGFNENPAKGWSFPVIGKPVEKIVSAISDEEQEFLQELEEELFNILDWHRVEVTPMRELELSTIREKRERLIKLFGLKRSAHDHTYRKNFSVKQ